MFRTSSVPMCPFLTQSRFANFPRQCSTTARSSAPRRLVRDAPVIGGPARFSSTWRMQVRTVMKPKLSSRLYKVAGMAGLGLSLSLWAGGAGTEVHCDALPDTEDTAAPLPASPAPLPPPPQSSVNLYELTFGTVCGVCAGVFVKKGAKALAFVLGGIFVLLQYLGSLSLVRVDWARASARFENLFYRMDAQGMRRAPNIGSVMRWLIDFLTADFQPRASFIAGMALGFRIG